MMYLRPGDLEGSNQDLRDFIEWSLTDDAGYPREVRRR
jgi:hypothetical protein